MTKTYKPGDRIKIKCDNGNIISGKLISETRLADIKPGETFGDYIVLEHFGNGTTAVFCKNTIKTMEFGSTKYLGNIK